MSKPKSDLWKRLVAEAGAEEDDAIGRAASVAVKQAEAELTGAGFDVPAERAKAAAFLDALESYHLLYRCHRVLRSEQVDGASDAGDRTTLGERHHRRAESLLSKSELLAAHELRRNEHCR